jgi:hypothetical protein
MLATRTLMARLAAEPSRAEPDLRLVPNATSSARRKNLLFFLRVCMAFLRRRAVLACLALWGLLAWVPAQALTLEEKTRALEVIARFSSSMCMEFAMEGASAHRGTQVQAGVQLNRLFKMLVQAGVSIETRMSNERYVGLMQRDLLRAIGMRNDCRRYYADALIEMLLSDEPAVLHTEMSAGRITTETIDSSARRCISLQEAGRITETCDQPKERK